MKNRLLIIIGFTLFTISIVSANAEEFDYEFIDSKNRTVTYDLTNAALLDIIQHSTQGFIFEANGTNGLLYVSLPKTIPILASENMPFFILLNGQEIVNLHNDDTNCFYNFQVPVNGNTKLEFIFSYWPERPLPVYYLDLPSECNMPYDKTTTDIKNKICSDERSRKFLNIRDKIVCVYHNHIKTLLDRGYLQPVEYFITEKYDN